MVVNPLQIGGLSAQTWTVVHQLAINFARRKIDGRHVSSVRLGQKLITRAEGKPISATRLSRVLYSSLISGAYRLSRVKLLPPSTAAVRQGQARPAHASLE